MSHIVSRGPCPDCGSSGARMEYSDGHAYCFKCEKYTPGPTGGQGGVDGGSVGGPWGVKGGSSKPLIMDGEIRELRTRGISLETCRKWGYTVSKDEGGHWVQLATYKNAGGQICGQHVRFADKEKGFPWRGERPKDQLYGQWLWGKGGKKVVVCEGELDALSASQANDLKWPVVSLSAGAHSAAKDLNHPDIMRWLDSFEQIVLFFDADDPGQKAARECAALFSPGKVFIAEVPGYKDANAALCSGSGGADLIRQAVWNAKPYAPVEICTLAEVFCDLPFEPVAKGVSWPWPEVTRITEGIRPHELTVLGAGIGVGKTTMTLELLAHVIQEHNWKVGVFPLEQTNKEFGHRLASMMVNKKLWPPARGTDGEAEFREAQAALEPYKHQIQVFQREHASSWERMKYIIRYMAASGTKLIVIDNLTGVVAGQETGDRVGLIDNIFKELGAIVGAFPVHIAVVSHLKRPQDDKLQHERGREVDMSDFRGAGSIGIFAHYCWGLEGDKYGEEPRKLSLLKDRPNGKVGRVGKVTLHYDEPQQRMYTAQSRGKMIGEKPPDGTPEALANDVREHSPDWQISAEGDNEPISAETDMREVEAMSTPETNGHRYIFDAETNGIDFDHADPPSLVRVIHCLVATNVNTGQVIRSNVNDTDRMKRLLKHLAESDEIIGHNILAFDIPGIQNLYPWFRPLGKVTDTKIMSQVMFPDIKPVDEDRWPVLIRQGLAGKHSLEAWGQRLGEPKDDYVKWCEENGVDDPWGQWSERQEDYCEQDTKTNLKLYQFLIQESNTAPGWDRETFDKIVYLEQEVAEIIRRQRKHGFAFDTKKAEGLYLELQKATDAIAGDLREKYVRHLIVPDGRKTKKYQKDMVVKHKTIPGCKIIRRKGAEYCPTKIVDFNPGSSGHVSTLLVHKFGWEPTEGALTDGSKDLYKQLKMEPGDILQAVKERRLEVSGAEEVLKALPYPFIDDVLHYQKQAKVCSMVGGGERSWLSFERNGRIHGKVNSLGAATVRMTHSDPNVAQTPSVSLDKKTGEPKEGLDGGFGFECRSCYTASPGKVLVGCDAEGLELRMLGHYMALYDGGAYAEAVIKGDKDEGTDVHTLAMNAMDYNDRNDAKTGEYAFLYGGGDEKLGLITFKQFTEEQAKAFGPPTPAKLKELGADIRAKLIGGFPGLEDLVEALSKAFGRGWLRGLDGRVLRPRKEHSILNLLLQSAGAIVMKHAMILADRRLRQIGLKPGDDYEFVANIHDEWQIEALEEHADIVAKVAAIAISKVERRLRMRVPLAGDSKIGRTWAETH